MVIVRFSRVGLDGLDMWSPQRRWSLPLMGHHVAHTLSYHVSQEGLRVIPLNPMACGFLVVSKLKLTALTCAATLVPVS